MNDFDLGQENIPAPPDARPETPEQRAARWQAVQRRYAEAAARAAALSRDVFQPLLREFQEVLESDGILVHGVPQQGHDSDGPHWACYTARDAASRKRLYSICLSALAFRDGPLLVSAECRHDAARACRGRRPKTPLAQFAPLNIAASHIDAAQIDDAQIDDEAAREWCEGALKRSAEAIVEAVYMNGTAPAAAAFAPVTPVLPFDVPAATMF